jgi:MFS transporter, ACS family, tartrate transporter
MRRVSRRLVPILFTAYIVNYLDRTNVSYAALQMSRDLHFSDRVFGLGAGIFFLGYILLQIPTALVVEHWGARRLIAGTMVIWGITSVLMALVRTSGQFYACRFLLGLAEAGFFPGIIVYLTHWITHKGRATATAYFMAAIPISFIIGSPVAAFLLHVRWLGLHGWSWIFVGEGIPAVIFGFVAILYLSDRPHDASWLTEEQRDWVVGTLKREKQMKKPTPHRAWWRVLGQRDVVVLSLVVLFSYTAFNGSIFWIPTILKRLSGFPDFKVALVSAPPYIVALLSMLVSGWHSDRSSELRWHAAAALFISGLSLVLASAAGPRPWVTIVAFTGAVSGFCAFLACFWAMPAVFLSGSSAAAAIGMINLIGSIGGFVGPYLVGYLSTRSGSFVMPLGVLAASMLIASVLATMPRIPRGHTEALTE